MTTKIVALVDALGNMVKFLILPGQAHDMKGVAPLIKGVSFDALLADKAFDADWLLQDLDARGATVLQQAALDYLRASAAGPFDLVFLDPPFADDLVEETCRLLEQHDLLAADALVYIELPKTGADPEPPSGWQVEKNKTAGNVRYMLVSTGD